MNTADKIEAYFSKEHPYKKGIGILRTLALKTALVETLKWGSPVYTVDNKNVLGIMAFKNYFGLWFFNGVFLKDPKKVLENAQEGKTKAMRHWKFSSPEGIDRKAVTDYIQEAIVNQKKGLVLKPNRKKETVIPQLLKDALGQNSSLHDHFKALSPFKQREYCEHISTAKQEKTKLARLEKIIPMIQQGIGFHDKYRN